MSASLTIFCNILTSPLNSRAREDLALFSKVLRLIGGMCTVSPGTTDSLRLRHLQEFVEELLRLGQAAIHKASESNI